MKAVRYIMNRCLFLEWCVNDSETSMKLWSVCCKEGEVSFAEELPDVGGELKKREYAPAFLLITGDSLVARHVQVNDAFYQRIADNPELLWDMYREPDSGEQTIVFLRKDCTEELFGLLERYHICLLKQWIREVGSVSGRKLLQDFSEEHFRLSGILRDGALANTCASVLYHRLRLPVLLCFFLILLGNFLLNTHFRKEYEQVQSELHLHQRNSRAQQAHFRKTEGISAHYRAAPTFPAALVADRIASYVPPRLKLLALNLFPLEYREPATRARSKGWGNIEKKICIRGETQVPGCVSLFSQYLESDRMFSGVRVISLTKKGNTSDFVFELEVELESLKK